jgi:hypothetical protein
MAERKWRDAEIDRLLETSTGAEISPELRGGIRNALKVSLRPVAPIPSVRALSLQFAAIFSLFAVGLIAVMGFSGMALARPWQALGITAILVVGVALFSVSLAWQISPGSRQWVPAKVSWVCYGLGLAAGAALLFPWQAAEAFVEPGWSCSLTGLAIAVPGGALFWLPARRGAPLSAGTFGGTLGAIAALLGITVLHFQCVYQEAAHFLVWHGSILLVAISGGILVARGFDRNRIGRPIEHLQ